MEKDRKTEKDSGSGLGPRRHLNDKNVIKKRLNFLLGKKNNNKKYAIVRGTVQEY